MDGEIETSGGARTVRQLIADLELQASGLAEGLDSRFELVICQGDQQQFIDHVEVVYQQHTNSGLRVLPDQPQAVLIIGHWHPGETPGRVQRALTADVDDELRGLTEGGGSQ